MVHCSPERRRLCSSLIKEFFGDTVEKVCNVLVARGQQTLPEVVHASSLPASTVRSALLVLLQHNFVVSELVKPDADLRAAPPPYYLYHADTGAIIQMLRMPRILQHVQREYGGPGESDMAMQIIEVLLAHGRLRLGQIVAAVAARLGRPEGEVQGEVHPRFISLVNSRHVEHVPPADLPLPKPKAHGKPQSKKKAEPKEGSKEKAEQEAEQLRKLAQKSYSDERFQLPIELLFGAAAPKAAKPAARVKRKRDEANDGGGQECEGATSQPLWRVNFEEFNCRLRDEACTEHMAEMHGREAAALVAAMLRHAAQQQPGGGRADAEVSAAVSASAAAEQLAQMRRRQPELPVLTVNAASRILCELAEDVRSGVKRVGLQEAFFVDLGAITKAMRQTHIEAIVRDRFPPIGMRVFRLLTARKQLEQKQVADYAMVPVRDARELLYRMHRAGFLTLQDVPRTADHAASRTFYTWRVDAAAVTRRVGEELLQTAANLRARLHREVTEHGEVLARVEAGDAVLLPRERAEVGRVSRMSALLETRLIALDPLIALFHR